MHMTTSTYQGSADLFSDLCNGFVTIFLAVIMAVIAEFRMSGDQIRGGQLHFWHADVQGMG